MLQSDNLPPGAATDNQPLGMFEGDGRRGAACCTSGVAWAAPMVSPLLTITGSP